ncbi:Glucooligosaccharide oxidase [Daedalea quercina L-15889]|uniref:Glucooligosaccharide oxidase n=1 Tax=Daedalea quercina L-15889 TaxID=1314783 RepID=A0A165LPX3_9APHY|nr:Glucooligosaccharide oxidase [Daedalea quercina L-15889]
MLLTFLFSVLCIADVALGNTSTTVSLQSTLAYKGTEVYFTGQAGYQNASQAFNLRLQFKPAAVAYPRSAEEVSDLTKVGASLGIPVSARSGGHSHAGYSLGGEDGHLVVDLSHINAIEVNSSTAVARVGTGNRLGDVALGLFNQGERALPHGTCPLVGISGHASYGGYGFTSRQWGLTLDNVIGATVVLANGSIVDTSASQYPDLFWALRGSAPSFGIVTHFDFRTFAAPVRPTYFSYNWSMPLDESIAAISRYQNFCYSPAIPREIGFELNFFKGAEKGEILLNFLGSYYGDPDEYEAVVKPFLDAMPIPTYAPLVEATSWLEHLELLAGPASTGEIASTEASIAANHDTVYTKSLTTPSYPPMPEEAIVALARWMSVEGWSTNTNWFVQLELYGGRFSQIDALPWSATAYANRKALWIIQFWASSPTYKPPYPEEGISFVDGLVRSITSNVPGTWRYGAYPNYIDPRLTPEEWQRAYYGLNYRRLQKIKAKYDPNGVFTFPQSM